MPHRIARLLYFATVFVAVLTVGTPVMSVGESTWTQPIPVTEDWITISKARDVGDFRLFRRYGFLLNDQSQLIPNLFILNCAHLSSNHFSYLAIILPKHYPIGSFRRDSWLPHLSVRFIVDGSESLAMNGEYRDGEIDIDYTPEQSNAFLKVIEAKNLAVGFGEKNDVLKFSVSDKVTSAFTDFVGKGDYKTTMGEIERYTAQQTEKSCLLSAAPRALSDNKASEIRATLTNVGGAFVVPVVINNAISLNFTVDSGAADVSVPIDVFSTLVRAGTIKAGDITGSQTYVTANGEATDAPTFIIRSLQIGGTTVRNVSGSVAPAQGMLLLGQSFLKRFKSWSIDNSSHELVLR